MGSEEETRSDADLLFAFRQGEVEALDLLVARYRGPLHGYLRALTGNAADADDLFQETWLRVVRNPGSFRGGAFHAWLWRIARNLLVDRLRRLRPTVSLDDATAEGSARVDALPADSCDPGEALAASDLERRIAAAVNRLPPDLRDVFLLRTQAGLRFVEIARLRRMPLNTALGRMHYAVQRLRQDLGHVYEDMCREREGAPTQAPKQGSRGNGP